VGGRQSSRLEIPLYLVHHENKGKNDQEIKGRGQVIKVFSILLKSPPDHDPDVWDKERDQYDNVINDRCTVIHNLFSVHLAVCKEKDQVYKGQEKGQVYKIGYFQCNGRYLTLPVQSEWLQENNGNDVHEQESGNENKMQQELKEIIHAVEYCFYEFKKKDGLPDTLL
jgi:hypothetical protein